MEALKPGVDFSVDIGLKCGVKTYAIGFPTKFYFMNILSV